MKTATIRARTEPGLKADAERVFRKLGISSSEAINLFYSQVRLRKGLPFPVEIPNAVTRQTFLKTDRGEDLHDYRVSTTSSRRWAPDAGIPNHWAL